MKGMVKPPRVKTSAAADRGKRLGEEAPIPAGSNPKSSQPYVNMGGDLGDMMGGKINPPRKK